MNLLSNDGQRIFEAVALGPLLIPGPVVLLFGLVYMFILIGPWSLIAMGTYGGFYPFMVSLFKPPLHMGEKISGLFLNSVF